MKRLLIFILVLFAASSVFGAFTYDDDYFKRNRGWAASGGRRDPLWLFMNEMCTELEAWTLDGTTTITFPTNGLTIDNAVDTRLEINENSDEFILVFGSNKVQLGSADVLTVDFNDIYVTMNEISTPTGDPSANTGWLYVKDNSGTTTLYFEDSAGLATSCIAGGTSTPGGSDTYIQYNNGGAMGGISGFIYDDTNIEVADEQGFAFGTDANAVWVYDDDVDDQLLLTLTNAGAAATTDPLFEVLCPASPTGDQQIFGIAKGSQSSNTALFTVDEDGDGVFAGSLTIGSTFYQTAIASAATGNVALNVDAAGTGVMNFGASSTGKAVFTRAVELDGAVTIGDASADNITFSGTVVSNVTMDDGTTDSPTFTLQDATDETCAIVKLDNGDTTVTIPADTDFEIVTGNLAVGDGTPGTASMDGEDFYVKGEAEFDDIVQFDGAITTASTATLGGDVTINDQIAVAFASNDEEIAVTGTATNMTAAAMATFTMAAQDSTKHIMRLIQTPDADADNEFFLCEDNAGDDKFEIEEGGTTTWTLDAASIVKIDADSTANTSTGGALDVDFQTNTNNGAAMTITVQQENSATQAYGLLIDLDDDCDDDTFDGIHIKNANGTNSTTRGLVLANTLDDGIVATIGAAGQYSVVDATTAANTGTAGVIDMAYRTATDTGRAIDIDVESDVAAGAETVTGIYMTLDDDANDATDILQGIYITTDGDATGLQYGLRVDGSGIDAALLADNGYVRIGEGSSADETLNDDDLFVEGTVEVDGKIYADGGVELDNTLIQVATVEISNAELEALQGTAKELVAAPGENKLLSFIAATLILDYSGAALTESTDNLAIEYDNGSAASATENIDTTGFIDQSADAITQARPSCTSPDAAADIVNKNLALVNVGDAEFGNGGSATSTLTVIITYLVHDTLGL